MSLAYLCDQCPAKAVIDKGAIHLPSGWVEATMEKGTGVMHNPKSTKHLCPSCSKKLEQAMESTPQLKG